MLLDCHQILQRIDSRLHTGGNDTGKDAGNVGAMLGGIEQGVLALANREFERALGDVIVEGSTRPFQALRQCGPMPQQLGDGFA